MPKLSQEQIDQAREVDLLAYLLSHESGVLKQEGANYRHITDVEQLSLFGGEKPSILGQLAATKEQSKTPAAPKQNKAHEPEL